VPLWIETRMAAAAAEEAAEEAAEMRSHPAAETWQEAQS
jgi:hypothetical protein